MSKRPNVLLIEKLTPSTEERLAEYANIIRIETPSEEHIISNVHNADAIMIRAKGKITKNIIEQAPNLKVIARHGVGLDNIDVETAKEKNIAVINTPNANFQSTAEFTIGLILNVCRKISEAQRVLAESLPWDHTGNLVGMELAGKTIGIVGMGKIGHRVAQICRDGFRMNVIYHDYKGRQFDNFIQEKSLEDLIKKSDIVSLHTPNRKETRGMMSRDMLKLMQPHAILINTSRGEIVDEVALIECLKNKKIAGAGIDVFLNEPSINEEWNQLDNAFITPHMAFCTHDALQNTRQIVDILKEKLENIDS